MILFGAENLIKNPSFEEDSNGKPASWGQLSWDAKSQSAHMSLDPNKPRSGKRSARIENTQANHSYFMQLVSLETMSVYRFSAWIRTSNVGTETGGAGIGVNNYPDFAGDIRGSGDSWKRVEMYIATGKESMSATVLLSLGWYGALNTGIAWFDDVELVKTNAFPRNAVVLSLDQAAPPEQIIQDQKKEELPKNRIAMAIFITLGITVILAGITYFVLIILINKQKRRGEAAGTGASPQDSNQDQG